MNGGWVPGIEKLRLADHRPKVLLVHSALDEVFSKSDCERLADAFRDSSIPTTLVVLNGQPHKTGQFRLQIFRAIAEWCKKTLELSHNFPASPHPNVIPLWLCLAPSVLWCVFWWHCRPANSRSPIRSSQNSKPTGIVRLQNGISVTVVAAVTVTIVANFVLQNAPLSTRSACLARYFLANRTWIAEFDDLSRRPELTGVSLKTVLDESQLAHYNTYELANWRIDEDKYFRYVLSPVLDDGFDVQFGWRRELWEYLYPRIKFEQSTRECAVGVVRALRERITIDSTSDASDGVDQVWRNGVATLKNFKRIYIAALRSVGIPARISFEGNAELWTGTVWEEAPLPLIMGIPELAQLNR
jgi:hypothetical protein